MPSRSSRGARAATARPPSERAISWSATCARRRLRCRHRLEERVTKRPVCFRRPIEVPYSLHPRLVVDEPSRQRALANTFDHGGERVLGEPFAELRAARVPVDPAGRPRDVSDPPVDEVQIQPPPPPR